MMRQLFDRMKAAKPNPLIEGSTSNKLKLDRQRPKHALNEHVPGPSKNTRAALQGKSIMSTNREDAWIIITEKQMRKKNFDARQIIEEKRNQSQAGGS